MTTPRRVAAERAMAEGRKRHALTVGELFPDGDVVGQWVFSVTALAEDIRVLIGPLREAMDEGDLRASLFYYRQLVARLYEARRLVSAAHDIPEVTSFLGDLLQAPPGGLDLNGIYRRESKDAPSRVEQLYGELRHRTVHYMRVGGQELRDALWSHSGYPARLEVETVRGRPEPWFQWVHAVTASDVFGDVANPSFLSDMRERSEFVGKIAGSWLMVAPLALILQAKRLGIPTSQLGELPGSLKRTVG
jgi:hypothetical protein